MQVVKVILGSSITTCVTIHSIPLTYKSAINKNLLGRNKKSGATLLRVDKLQKFGFFQSPAIFQVIATNAEDEQYKKFA